MRSLLLVSVDTANSLGPASRAGADALVVDLTRPTERRTTAKLSDRVAALKTAPDAGPSAHLYGRINGFLTDLVGVDLDTIMPVRPDAILLMDTVGSQDLARLGAMLAVHEADHGFGDGSTRIIAMVSSARGVLAAGSLAGGSRRLAGIAWDAEALRGDLGGQSTLDEAGAYADPYRTARAMTLFAAAVSRVCAIDTVSDSGAIAEQCRSAGRDGFSAKLAINPAQVPIINAAFPPTPR